MKPAVCIEMLYGNLSAEEKIERIANAGFKDIEFWAWRDKNLDAVAAVCSRKGVTVANFSGQRVGDLVSEATHQVLLADYLDALEAAKKLGTKTLMVLTNELGEGGVVRNEYVELSTSAKRRAVVAGIAMLLDHTPADMHLVLEPLNTVQDHKGYFLSSIETTAHITKEIGDPRFKILCDLYHQGMMKDDPLALIDTYSDSIGYYHVADYPGRHEPGTGSADWKRILRAIDDTGYSGYVGFEYEPTADSDESLKTIADLWVSI